MLTGVKVSAGTTITLGESYGTPYDGWCLFAKNANLSKAVDDANFMTWRSLQGGLDPDVEAMGCA